MRFRYLRDPLFLTCLVLYFVNRLLLKPLLPWTFLHSYLNDVICIPFWVPIMLLLMRGCHLRHDDGPPRSHEVLIPLMLWSLVFEVWLPQTETFRRLATADHLDVLSYTAGALLAGVFWRYYYGQALSPQPMGTHQEE
jgi:hypothetical protein